MTENSDQDRLVPFVFRHVEALARLWQARLGLAALGWQETVSRADVIAEAVAHRLAANPSSPGEFGDHSQRCVRRIEGALHRVSRLVPGSTCIHRALAAQKMLVARDFGARLVIGLRKGAVAVEGHAWLEVWRGDKSWRAFWSDEAGYTAVVDPRRRATPFAG